MNRAAKLAYARAYCRTLVSQSPAIVAIALGGSVARGDDLPVSDLDLWCFVDAGDMPLPISKHQAEGVYVDIELQPAEMLTREGLCEDPYVCGYLRDALILYDREGRLAACQVRVRAALASPAFRRAQLAAIRASVMRNADEFAAALPAWDAPEICRASIFAAWSLSDHMLTRQGLSPGGARGLARLAVAWPAAAHALIAFEQPVRWTPGLLHRLLAIQAPVADPSSFFDAWVRKVTWLGANGHAPDALHALWIALGLRIKAAQGHPNDAPRAALGLASAAWLGAVGWDPPTARAKLADLQGLIACFGSPDSEERRSHDIVPPQGLP